MPRSPRVDRGLVGVVAVVADVPAGEASVACSELRADFAGIKRPIWLSNVDHGNRRRRLADVTSCCFRAARPDLRRVAVSRGLPAVALAVTLDSSLLRVFTLLSGETYRTAPRERDEAPEQAQCQRARGDVCVRAYGGRPG